MEHWRVLEAGAVRHHGALSYLAARLLRDHPDTADRVAEQILVSYVDRLWRAGWQPREVVRQARRRATRAAAQVVELAVLADHERHAGQAIDPRWAEQLAELTQRDIPTRDGWLHMWRRRHGHAEQWAVEQVARAMASISRLPALDVLVPPPGQPGARARGLSADAATDDPVLRKVRKLLEKAESTPYVEEADSLTAKAHKLMTKHAIDQALLQQDDRTDGPRTMRVPIDPPYADAKSLLLHVVAGHQRCRAVMHGGLDISSVVGHADDLRSVELLFTSLLVQAKRALGTTSAQAGMRGRTQSYRAAFYVAFAHRIGERLAFVTEEVLAEVGDGAHLPVLRAREEAVGAAFDERWGDTLTTSSVRGGRDPLGHAHGRQAADAARFGSDELGSRGA